jgi:hypothetical protein
MVPLQVIYDDGAKDMPFYFRVVNAKTGQPVRGAIIHLGDYHRRWQQIETGLDGRASIELTCMTACKIRQGMLLHTSRRSIYYPDRLIMVSAAGFKDTEPTELTDLVGRSYVGEYRPPPEVEIRLEPAAGD